MSKICYYHLDMNFKRSVIFIGAMLATLQSIAQDAIIFRDGRVKSVKIIQTNNDKTLFKESGNKKASEEFVENTKVFMLKFKTRGNVVFNANGERILTTSEHTEIPKDAIVVYYKDGREVPAYNLTMDASVVSFKTTKKAKDRPIFSPKSEVFMIRYPDGTRDILSNLAVAEQQQREREAEEAKKKEEEKNKVDEAAKNAAEKEVAEEKEKQEKQENMGRKVGKNDNLTIAGDVDLFIGEEPSYT